MGDLILAEKSDLIMLANTIREKTGSTDQMSFVDGFVNGINNLKSGSSVEISTVTIDVSVHPLFVCYTPSLNQECVLWAAAEPLDTPAPFQCVKGTIIYIDANNDGWSWNVVGGTVMTDHTVMISGDVVTISEQ